MINRSNKKYNLHTHSLYCDGKNTIKENIISAIDKYFFNIGFSSHAPLKYDNNFSLKYSKLNEYSNEIEKLALEFKNKIQIYKGLECDYIPSFTYPFSYFKELINLDFIIGGVHLVENPNTNELWFIDGSKKESFDNGLKNIFNNNIKLAVKQYFIQLNEMIAIENFDIIAHFDKIKMHNDNRYFSENDDWYRNLCYETINLIKEKNLIVEINSRGLYKNRTDSFYPSSFIMKEIKNKNIRITISTDSHNANEQDLLYKEAIDYAKSFGFIEFWTLIDCQFNNISI